MPERQKCMSGNRPDTSPFLPSVRVFLTILFFLPVLLVSVVPVAAQPGKIPGKTRLAKALKRSIDIIGVPGAVLAVAPAGRQPLIVPAGLSEIQDQEIDEELLASLDKKNPETSGLSPEVLLPNLAAATVIRGIPMKIEDKFRVASIEKTFVAAAVLLLARDGVLNLNDPVGKWLKSTELPVKGVQIRHLLTHRSGLPNYTEHPEFYSDLTKSPLRKWSPRDLLAYADFREAYFGPGEDARYSNTNYVLLAMILEKAAGRPYAQVVRDRVIDPTGLKNTFFPGGPEIVDGFAGGYRHNYKARGRWRDYSCFVDPSWAWGHGRLVSNAEDLASFMTALFEGRLLGRDLTEKMMTFDKQSGTGVKYGLGIKKWPDGMGHDGNYVFGYQSLMIRHAGLDWVVLTNGMPTRIGLINGPMEIWRLVRKQLEMQ